jgi:uncharacterized 2Fe-2S/4Fe-4S cluster protein (DUF4445 family)
MPIQKWPMAAERQAKPMPVLHVTIDSGKQRHISFVSGASVREVLGATDIGVRSDCGGQGACGLCLVSIERGNVNTPTANERRNLSEDRIHRSMRLACQVRPFQDVWITIENPAIQSNWRPLCADEHGPPVFPPTTFPSMIPAKVRYGAAVDLGTTQIRLSLWDMATGRRLAGCSGLNPQAWYGADVLTRLTAASESEACAREISRLARNALGEALQHIRDREFPNAPGIGCMVIVGNTAMLALLTGRNHGALLQPDYWMREVDYQPDDTTPWCISWGLDTGARIAFARSLGGFVGSDLLAGVIATQLTDGSAGALLMDFGTNSEIALWDGRALWVTSTAAGSAFEGCGIGCGMPAQIGAIYRVGVEPKGAASEFHLEVIGGGAAKGLCGSGLVDLIACLRKAGILKSNGTFMRHARNQGGVHIHEGHGIVLKKRDVDIFQRAKAAIGAGTTCLMEKAGMRFHDLKRVCVCGAFGRFLNITNAKDIGLLPDVSIRDVELFENAALAGCERLLFSKDRAGTLDALKKKARLINLTTVPAFEDRFIENLYLQPMKIG